MSFTAFSGAIVTFPSGVTQGDPSGQNPDAGPALICHGYAIQDIRLPFCYQPGQSDTKPTYGLAATKCLVLDQAPSAISTTNIAAGQHCTASTALTLVSTTGSGITVGVSITNASTGKPVTGLLAIDGASSSVTFGSAASLNIWDPTTLISRCVGITVGASSATAVNFTVAGYDIYGYPMTQTLAGPGSSATVYTTKAFKYIASVTPSANFSAANISIGTSDIYGLPLRADRQPYVEAYWANNQILSNGTSSGTAVRSTQVIPAQLADLTGTEAYQIAVPFNFTVLSFGWRTGKPASTSGKTATLTAQVNAVSVTGGAVTITTANQNATGTLTAASAITAGNTGTAGQTVGFVLSSVTAFVEGDGWAELVVQNNDLAGDTSGTSGTFTAADTTSPATASTNDVRGTVAIPTASNGTNRLMIWVAPAVANMSSATGLFGVTQD